MLSPEYTMLIGLGLFLILYYYAGLRYYRRLSQRIYRWLQRGLTSLGNPNQAQANWLGSNQTGARIKLARAHIPFEQIELIYVVEGRALLWLINMWRGKRDLLLLRGRVRRPPTGELEVLPPDNKALQAICQATENPWTVATGPHNLVVAWRSYDNGTLERLRPFLEQYGALLKRLSWGPKDPHFLLALRLAGLQHDEAAHLFQAVRTMVGKLH